MDTIFVLNTNRQVIDVLSNNGSNPSAPFFGDTYTSELDTGAESYEFTTINNARTNVTLEVGNYVLFKYNGKYKLFQIMETTDEHSEGKKLLTVYAEMAGMELRNDYCEPFTLEGNFINLLERVLQDTNWRVGTYSESLLYNIQSISYTEPKNVYSIIQENLATFGGVEIEFRVEFIGNQLAALLIDCYESGTRGNKKYRRFEYGKDVKGITRERNINDLATAVIGQGNNNLTFKDIEWSKNLGNPCDKPLQQDFVVDIEANDLWNNGGKYIKTVHKVDTDDAQTLLQECWDYLQEIKQPKFDYDVDLALVAEDYQDIGVGDTNYVLDFDYQPAILLEARVGKLELSFADPRDNKCTLTNYKELVSILQQPVDLNTVGNMIQSHFPIEGEDIAMGAIGEGHINVTYYQAIKTDIMSATLAEVGTLIADKADITDLTALNANIENLRATKAEISDLNATNGNITNLTSQVGQIDTIINNHFTGTDSQILNITAENTTIDNAVIKNAMIDTVSADKVNAGTINTNNVVIESEDGGIRISGATQQFKDNTGTVRVQIGKDAQGNFTFCLFSQDGTGILLDETGIKAGAVPNGLIVNDMVSDTANIAGSKLDISSVITSINNNTTSIKSSAIKFDDTGQTLQVAFNELKTKVETIEEVTIDGDLSSVIEQVTTNTTNIGVMQGQISSLITNTTITKQDGTVVQLKDEYNNTVSTVNSNTTKIGSLETNYDKVSGDIVSVTSKQSTLERNLNEVSSTLTQTTTTANAAKTQASSNKQTIDSMSTTLTNTTKTANEAKTQSSTNKQSIDSMSTTLTSTTNTANDALNKATTAQQNLDGFKTTVSNTYTTKTDFNNLSIGGRNLLKDSKTLTKAVGVGSDSSTHWTVANTRLEGFKQLYVNTTSTSWITCYIPLYAPINTLTQKLTVSFEYYESPVELLNFSFGVFKADGTKIKEITNRVVSKNFKVLNSADGSWTRVSYTFDPSSVNNQTDATEYRIQFKKASSKTGVAQVRKIKLEIGNKATDWTPAPEDVDDKFTNYATKKSLSEVKQTADSVTSTVSNMKIGGRNLLLNTMFEGAIGGTKTCPNWTFNSGSQIFGRQGQESYNEENTIYIEPTKDATATSIDQKINSSIIPKNTTITVSGIINAESNVLGYEIWLKFYDSSNTALSRIKLRDTNNGYGYFEHTLTTPNVDYTTIKYQIFHKGATSISEGAFLLMPKNLMLEIGTKASNWQPAPGDMASKSVVTQTADQVRFDFKHQGTANLQRNGNGGTYNHDGWFNWKSEWYHGDACPGYIVHAKDGSGCVQAPYIRCAPNTTYSVKVHVCPEVNTGNFKVNIKQLKSSDSSYHNYKVIWGADTQKGWHTVKATFTTDADIDGFHVELWSDGRKSTEGNYVTFFSELMVFEGADYFPNCYVPYTGGIYGNTTTIDDSGVTVYMDNASNQNARATLNFDGLTIFGGNGSKRAWFGESDSAFIDKIMCNKIDEPSLLRKDTGGCYNVYCAPNATGDGTGRDENNRASSITNALEWFRSTYGTYLWKKDVHVHLAPGDYWGADNYIGGWLGTGSIWIDFDQWACLRTPVKIEENAVTIYLEGTVNAWDWNTQNNAYIYLGNVNGIIIRRSTVIIGGLNIQKEGWGGDMNTWDGYGASCICAAQGSRVFVKCCDIVGFWNCVYANDVSLVCVDDCRGHCHTMADVTSGSILIENLSSPLFLDYPYYHDGGQILGSFDKRSNSFFKPKPDAPYTPPPTPTENWQWTENTWNASSLWTTPEGSGSGTTARSGCWGQGSWSSYKSHRGYASFDGVHDWCAGGRNFTAYLTMTRQNTSHGYSDARPVPKLKQRDGNFWSCGQGFARGDTKTIQLPWEVASWLIEGASNNLEMWAGSSHNDYSFYDNVSIRITCEKNFV